jgi:hypothetical protein
MQALKWVFSYPKQTIFIGIAQQLLPTAARRNRQPLAPPYCCSLRKTCRLLTIWQESRKNATFSIRTGIDRAILRLGYRIVDNRWFTPQHRPPCRNFEGVYFLVNPVPMNFLPKWQHPNAMKGKRRILEHIAFWSLNWLMLTLSGGLYDLDFGTTALYNLSILPVTILCTYLFVYRILPLYFQQHLWAFVVCAIFAFGSAILLKRLSTQLIQYPLLYGTSDYTFTFFNAYRMMGHFMQLATTAGIVAGLKYFRDWQRTKDKVVALSAEKRAAELSLLKAQVHPHFLFNTLNSIYYEVLRKSPTAPDLIIRLSDILRFTLYECKDACIPLSKEIELIQNYIALEQCRYGDRLTVAMTVQGDPNCQIPPLVCFSLVENAFKHGTANQTGASHIEIQFEIDATRMRLEIRNPIAVPSQADVLGATKGIGLHNITQQLELIFQDQYTLKSTAVGDRFVSRLDIPLSCP